MPPQNQADIQDPNYKPIDPQKDILGFVSKNKDAIQRMPEDKQIKFVDMLFRRYALPKYQKVNQQRPLDQDEISGLRLQFAARLLGIPYDPKTQLKDEPNEPGKAKKVAAALEGGGAGVLGGIRTLADLSQKIDKHLGPIGEVASYVHGRIGQAAGKAEGKAYEDASAISPGIASTSAAVGHQIPAAIATHGVEGLLPTAAKTAPLAAKVLSGGARGAAGGATFEASRPGGDPASGAMWGGALGAAFPFLGKLFGLGKKAASGAGEAVAATREGASAASPAAATEKPAASLGDVANKTAKEAFGKPFKDLTSAEKAKMPSLMKEEIKKQAAQKAATAKATKAAAQAGKEAEQTAKRAEAAKAATEKAESQAAKRASTGTVAKATAAKAAEENPAAAKHMAMPTEPESEMERIRRNPPEPVQEMPKETQKAAEVKPTKVPAEATGPKVRAKEGKPASPAQQAADRERIAEKRELAKKEEFGAALDKHAQEMAGRHTSASLGIMHVPELEGAIKEMPEGEYMLKTLQKAKRAYKWSDEIYAESLKEWLLNQFEKEAK